MFTQSCFIRKNTPEIRKRLEELGYLPPSKMWYDKNFAICTILRDNVGEYIVFKIDDDFENVIKPSYPYIDCGANEDLFFAIASMTDDKNGICDYYIVTVDGNSRFAKGSIHRSLPLHSCIHPSCYRKATVEEIIEYFKKN